VTLPPEPPPYADFVEYLAKLLVDNPEAINVAEEWDGDRLIIHLTVSEDDMGRIIGRGGRVAQAMRALLKVAAIRSGERVALEIG
jgi:predicted RNA-binding protein YlqC (UPF0109 family)